MDFSIVDCSQVAFRLRGGYWNSILWELLHRDEIMQFPLLCQRFQLIVY
jgi:hypothetical protein